MPKLFTTEEAADYLKIHKGTLKRYVTQGRIQASVVGQGYRFAEEELVAFFERQKVQPKPQEAEG